MPVLDISIVFVLHNCSRSYTIFQGFLQVYVIVKMRIFFVWCDIILD